MPKTSTALTLPPVAKEVPAIISEAHELKITDAKSLALGVEILSRLNQIGDKIKEQKDKRMRPLLDAVENERALYRPAEEMLKPAIADLRADMSAYQTEAKRVEQEEKDKIAARIGEGKGKLKMDTALAKMDEVEVAEKSVEADSGSITFKTEKRFEVIDIKLLPVEYLLSNDTEIRKSMKAGKELPGVKYYTEEVPINSR